MATAEASASTAGAATLDLRFATEFGRPWRLALLRRAISLAGPAALDTPGPHGFSALQHSTAGSSPFLFEHSVDIILYTAGIVS